MKKLSEQSKLGIRGFIELTRNSSLFVIERSQDRNTSRTGTWRRERMQGPWRDAAYWLAPHCLPGLLFSIPQDLQPRMASLPMGWARCHQSLIKTTPRRLAHSPTVGRYCLFANDSGLCQVDINLTRTEGHMKKAFEKRCI